MKLFVGYGYNARDEWIEKWVFPLIESFDFKVVSGKGLEGQDLRDEVKRLIEQSRAAIGFATRRELKADATWTTHRWVVDELMWADAKGLRSVEVRESGVEKQAGLRDGLGRVEFDDGAKEALLVQLATVLQGWRRDLQSIRLQLLPAAIHKKIIPHYRKKDEFSCVYRIRTPYGDESEPIQTSVFPEHHGLYIKLRDVPLDALIQVEISHLGKTVCSNFEPIDVPGITLEGDL